MIKQAQIGEEQIIADLAIKMWNTHSIEDLKKEFYDILSSQQAIIYIAYHDKIPIGFAQCQLRHDYVEGTKSSPVGYLEGIFVEHFYRHHKIATQLLRECENWAREKGCLEFASDCEYTNKTSFHFHLNTGFQEANKIICFTKKL